MPPARGGTGPHPAAPPAAGGTCLCPAATPPAGGTCPCPAVPPSVDVMPLAEGGASPRPIAPPAMGGMCRWPAGDTAYDTRRPLPPSCLQAANKSRVAAAMAPPTAPPSPPSCLLSPLSAPAPNHTPPAVATQGTPYRGGGRLCYHDPDVPPAEGVARSRPVRCQVVHRKATILGGKANYGKQADMTQ
ncbi:proline-rich protein 36-like [Sorghum bicolor]|uniref:Uncharacterized protein n=1 Tax=Sorghum bicolor TaxID=4558 RepID=A0A1B6QKY9_SORBI|nr:proline-rich protein 36-like [Sorghum bicolor]KXG38586.1 hypothetical protein SORBI_3001G255400 [Sorghum bicolor]|eukprot:XP_021307661.1 proline-rich protein 36-like [Sorghum bicolor]